MRAPSRPPRCCICGEYKASRRIRDNKGVMRQVCGGCVPALLANLRGGGTVTATNSDMANTKQAERWVELAREMARVQMGTSANLLTPEVRKALVCQQLVGILAGQDESCRNADTMVAACALVLQEE